MLSLRRLTPAFHRPRRRAAPASRLLAGCEVLEPRRLLSAAPAADVVHVAAGDAHDDAHGEVHELQLRIVGTTIGFDEATGLPSFMAGEIYYSGGARDGQFAGTYEEHLTPILHPEYGFIGTVGVSTFRFHNARGVTTFGEVTTVNHSYITGFDETGAICVASTGQITGGSRRLADVSGGISCSSTVILGPSFSLDVHLTLQFQKQAPSGMFDAGPSGQAGQVAQNPAGQEHPPLLPPSLPRAAVRASGALDLAFADWHELAASL
ncbi:MAG TPA: hypothetical protein VML55_03095 [Planctomycetaceae bacterium]|nr:hypothetical protein [Planctomycetaceae bacterium]